MLQSQVVCDVLRQVWRRRLAIFSHSRRRRRCPSRFAAEVAAFLVIPGGLIVSLRSGVEPGIEPVFRQFETVLDYKRRIRVVDEIFLRNPVVLDGVMKESAKKGNVRTGSNLAEEIGHARRSREP